MTTTTTTEKKMTKRDYFNEIIEILEDAERDDLINVIKHELELLDKKAASTKAAQDKKKAAGDPVADAVLAALTDTPARIADIVVAIGNDGITAGMCVNRLTKLVNAGLATKSTITILKADGTRSGKATAYALAPADGE